MADYKVLKDVVGSSLNYGNTVYFTESGEQVPYILVHPGNSHNFLFMRKYAPSDKVEFFAEAANIGVNDEQRIYEGRTLDNFLNKTFFNRFDATWQKIFVDNNISVTKIKDGNSVSYGINRKIFAPSATELGIGEQQNGTVPTESPFGAYKYFKTSAQNKRLCKHKNEDGDTIEYWTRSKNNHVGVTFNYYALTIDENGGYDTDSWQKNRYYVRPVLSINERVTVVLESTGWRIIPNLPPEFPSFTHDTGTVKNGEPFTVNWAEAVDEDGPSSPRYLVQQKNDSGEWYDVTTSINTDVARTLTYKEAESFVRYRVRAFDDYGNYSDWKEVAIYSVTNNLPPSAPSFVTVNGKYKNEPIAVSWGKAVDEDDNLKGYQVYRSINNGAYALVTTTAYLTFRDVAGDWDTVKYKVCAIDECNVVSSSYAEASVSLTNRITMTVNTCNDSDLYNGAVFIHDATTDEGDVAVTFEISDTKADDVYNVAVVIDGSFAVGHFDGVAKGKHECVIERSVWQRIGNGFHNLDITVYNSSNLAANHSASFKKVISGACITLKEPVVLNTEENVTKFLFNLAGSIPEDAILSIRVTNNANDSSPVWQTVTTEQINKNEFVDFTNKKGNAFNFIVTVDRGPSDVGGYISSINGMFGMNVFEYIFSRLDELEGG